MDYKSVVDAFSSMACIVSVEKNLTGSKRAFRIVTGNDAYIYSVEHPTPNMRMFRDKFVPDLEYTEYLVRDLNFEEYCYRSAVEKKCLHSYVFLDRMQVWFNMSFIPLESDDDELGYCIYLMEVSSEASAEKMSNISGDIASSVLATCIRLRGTNDFRSTMTDVIRGIRPGHGTGGPQLLCLGRSIVQRHLSFADGCICK